MNKPMNKRTEAIHTPYPRRDPYGALSMPVYDCCAYEFANHKQMADAFCGRSDEPDYSRVTNPTVMHLEDIVRHLSGAQDVVSFNSGMAAISATFIALCGSGKKVVTSRHMFGNTYLLLSKTLARFGVETSFVDLTDLDAVRSSMTGDTAIVYVETITNPQMEVADLKALAEIAHGCGAALVADSTMIPFTFADIHSLGVDIEVLSSTKYLSGGATSLGGLVIDYGSVKGFGDRLRRESLMNLGGYMTTHPAYMQTLGMETLYVRYLAQERTAQTVAEALQELPGVDVCYPGLESNQYHEICKRQFGSHYSAMLTFSLPTEKDCYGCLDALNLIKRATNLFDNRSLAIHPYSTIFGTLPEIVRREMDISPCMIRISIGLENPLDLIEDLRQAISKSSINV